MQKAQQYLRRYWPNLRVALFGLSIGMVLFFGLYSISPHPGESCAELGKVADEWALGVPPRPLICMATTAGDLRYGLAIVTPKEEPTHR